MTGTCKLCEKEADICQSHIIPEWGYERSYDSKHRFSAYDIIKHREGRIKQKGERERLLCGKCESTLSVWESYAKSVWERNTGKWIKIDGGGLWGSGLDYGKLKLFLLSVLWRSDIATGDIGENVSLGPHSENVRLMLLEDDPKELHLYPCMMMRIMSGNTWKKNGLRWPIKGRWHGQIAYSVAFKGIGLLYVIGNQKLTEEQQRGCVDESGNVFMGTSQSSGWSGHMGNLKICWSSLSAIRRSLPSQAMSDEPK